MLKFSVLAIVAIFAAAYVHGLYQKTAANVRHSIVWSERLKAIAAQEEAYLKPPGIGD